MGLGRRERNNGGSMLFLLPEYDLDAGCQLAADVSARSLEVAQSTGPRRDRPRQLEIDT
jgi:hypothetical protein